MNPLCTGWGGRAAPLIDGLWDRVVGDGGEEDREENDLGAKNKKKNRSLRSMQVTAEMTR